MTLVRLVIKCFVAVAMLFSANVIMSNLSMTSSKADNCLLVSQKKLNGFFLGPVLQPSFTLHENRASSFSRNSVNKQMAPKT